LQQKNVDRLIHRVPDNGPLGKVSFKVLSAKCDEQLAGDDLAAVLTFIAQDPALAKYEKRLREEHKNWTRETMK
jgi:hypothetical protein